MGLSSIFSSQSEKYLDFLNVSVDTLKGNYLRTFLSLSGIVVGISAIVLIYSINESGERLVFSELESFGLKSFWVYRNKVVLNPNEARVSGTGIVNQDLISLKNQASLSDLLSPMVVYRGEGWLHKGRKYYKANVVGVSNQYHEINNEELLSGKYIDEYDIDNSVCGLVISSSLQRKLNINLTENHANEIKLDGRYCKVIGVVREKSRNLLASIGASNEGDSEKVFLPYSTVQKMNGGNDDIDYLQGTATTLVLAESAKQQVIELLGLWNTRFSYEGEAMVQYIETASNIIGSISLVSVATSLVCLFIGGVGILNIMIVSVLERTKEIGIRVSIGASRRDILVQFLIESSLITSLGALIGIVFSVFLILSLDSLVPLPINISTVGLIVSVGGAQIVGILAGLYPAIKAANLDPVEALRYE